ncbi:MAG: ABC transporter ATP-binding protein [Bacillota bacterium]
MIEVIDVNALTKIFCHCRKSGPRQIVALDQITMTVNRGEIIALLGPNGAGKTTLTKILSTLILPTCGTATVNGYDVLTQSAGVRASIGFSPGGERSFYFRLTGRQNLEFFGALQGLRPRLLHRRISEVLDLLDLGEEADKRFMKYSSGMRRKLGIARALLTDPPVLLLDEPTSSVDPASARHIREHIKELKAQGRAILLTTHNIDEAERISDRIGILDKGRLIAVDNPANLRGILHQCRLRLVIRKWGRDSIGFISALRSGGGVPSIAEGNPTLDVVVRQREPAINEVVRLIVEYGVEVESIATIEPSLEEIFLSLTGGETCRV